MRTSPLLTGLAIGALGITLVSSTARARQDNRAAVRFDVASVKLNRSGAPEASVLIPPDQGRVRVLNVPLDRFIQIAYELEADRLLNSPTWSGATRYDLNARGRAGATDGEMLAMLRNLLEERFKLRAHTERRALRQRVLMLARPDGRLGRGLTASTAQECSALRAAAIAAAQRLTAPPKLPARCANTHTPLAHGGGTRWEINGVTIPELAETLGPMAQVEMMLPNRMLRDDTGLSGTFDATMEFSKRQPDAAPNTMAPAEPRAPAFIVALRDQLGLTIGIRTRPAEVLVIDHLERPTPD